MQDRDGRSALRTVLAAIGHAILMIAVWVFALGVCWYVILWQLGII